MTWAAILGANFRDVVREQIRHRGLMKMLFIFGLLPESATPLEYRSTEDA